MLKNILYILFFLSPVALLSQRDPFLSFYKNQMSIINPAFSGIEYDYSLTFNSRNQWATIENSPSTQFFSISSKREKNLGIGLSFVANKAFIESRTMAYIDFSYKLQISSDTNLFLGLKPGGTFFDINFNNLSFNSDPALVNYSKFSPNLGIGVLLKSNKFWLSLSTPRIFNSTGDGIINSYATNSNIYSAVGVNLNLMDNIVLKPSLLARFTEGYESVLDLSTFISVNNRFEFGFNYRTNNSLSGLFLVNIKNFRVGYAYETSSNKSGYSINLNTHEILFTINIDKGGSEVTEETE
ncbi:MAG: type IX secretion system membrane protein PorP/SprF [Flavobacteriaceae bacterium]|nr:type IX secretion system membrane protein PorP/SprF [Flavobacteriaceae bacterium]